MIIRSLILLICIAFPIIFADDSDDTINRYTDGIWIELKGIVDGFDTEGKTLTIKGLNIDISQAKVEAWRPLKAGHFIEAEGWLITSQNPFVMKAIKIELKGVGYHN